MKPIQRNVFIYLYYNPLTNSFAARRLARDVEDALKILNSGRKLDPRLAQRTANCIGEKESDKGHKVYYRKAQVMTRKPSLKGAWPSERIGICLPLKFYDLLRPQQH